MEINSLPSNSLTKKETKPQKKTEKVISGEVISKKKGLGRRLSDIFLNGDLSTVKEYLIFDLLIPEIKETTVKVVEMLLFGDTSRGKKKSSGSTYVSYRDYSEKKSSSSRRTEYRRDRILHDFDDLVLESRGEAEHVLDVMVELLGEYGQVTVADLYDAVGITSKFSDNNYGWTDLRNAYVNRVRDGYKLNLPRCQQLD